MRCFLEFDLPVLEYCSEVWCSAADKHFKLLDRVTRCKCLLTGCVFECNTSHRRSAAVLCVLFKIRYSPIHPLHGVLPVPYVLVRFTCVLWLIAHQHILMRLLAAESRRTAGLLFHSHYLCGTTLLILHSMVWNWRVL